MKWDEGDFFCSDLPTRPRPEMGTILVTGATGYVGGRLVPELLNRGYRVRAMVRSRAHQPLTRWPGAEIVVADSLEPESLNGALQGIDTAFYLMHSLYAADGTSVETDIRSARNFRNAAEEAGVSRVIYLGSLWDEIACAGPTYRDRWKVAEELRGGRIAPTILRADVINGSGSAFFELTRHLVRNCPVLIVPAGSKSKCRPIAIRDVIKYLVAALETPEIAGRSLDIRGPDEFTLEELLKTVARILGKSRIFLQLPFPFFRLYAYFAGLVTPVPAPVARCIFEGLFNDTGRGRAEAETLLPFRTISFMESILRALSREERDRIYTRWTDAYPPAHELAIKLDELGETPHYTSGFSLLSSKSAPSLFQSTCGIGGKQGWFHTNLLWRIRGFIDRALLGVGTSRGRRSSSDLVANDVIDFWRVEDLRENRMLLLRAEMKLPGRAWLKFMIEPEGDKNRLSVKAYYQANGFWGRLYWYVFIPFHAWIFRDLIQEIDKRSA